MKGLMWMDGKPFMEGVTMMFPFWLWRAIGGTMMWLSHLIFAYNFYQMVKRNNTTALKSLALEKIRKPVEKMESEMVVS